MCLRFSILDAQGHVIKNCNVSFKLYHEELIVTTPTMKFTTDVSQMAGDLDPYFS